MLARSDDAGGDAILRSAGLCPHCGAPALLAGWARHPSLR